VIDRPDRPFCAGITTLDERCAFRARLGSRFCSRHTGQRPDVPLPYLVECLSKLAPHPSRVHLHYSGSGMLLCTGTSARGPQHRPDLKPCPDCRRLAVEAVERGEVEPDHLRRWNLGEPNVDEQQR
jgi:hypothetical protein